MIAAFVTVAGLVVLFFAGIGGSPRAGFAFVQNIELRSLDARFNLRGKRPVDPRIVIVDLDEETLQRVGSYPIARSEYARLVDRLHQDGARIVALDIAFPTPEKNSAVEALRRLREEVGGEASPAVRQKIAALEAAGDHDRLLAASLRSAGNVILGHLFLFEERAQAIEAGAAEAYMNIAWAHAYPQVFRVDDKGDYDIHAAWKTHGTVATAIEANIEPLAESALSFGYINNLPDADGTMRRALLLIRYRDMDYYPPLALEVVRAYEKIPDQDLKVFLHSSGLERIELGPRTLRTHGDGTVLINYAGPYQTYPHYSMVDVLDGTVPADTFRDKIVLFGPTAIGIGDIRNTPFAEDVYMGVEIHANIVDNLLHLDEPGRGFLTRGLHQELVDIAFIVLFGLGLGAWFARTRPLAATLAVVVALLLFIGVVHFGFALWGVWLSFVVPAGTLVANYAGVTSYRMIFEEREKRRVRKTFSSYVSPGVIRLLEKDPARYFRSGGEMKDLTVMFSDIRGFTSIAEGLTPDELVALLNEYLGEMTEILFRRWGTLDKYIGDAIMAFWGSPFPQDDHAERACACALEMSARLEELNAKWKAEGRKPLVIGIGLNTGPVNVGNMGSNRRLSWTVMGDHVNLASRLEGLTKEYGVRIVLSEFTWREVQNRFVARELDRIRVKGKQQPVGIFELVDSAENGNSRSELLAPFADAMNSYRSQRWQEAAQKFEALLTRFPDDGPARVFLRRSLEFSREAPPADWDGVYVMKSK